MTAAAVKEFDPVKGFGMLTLETGEELLFDISASNKRDPRPGDRAEVTIGVGWKGKPKAKLVIFELAADRSPAFADGVEQLRAFGFLREWDGPRVRAAARELYAELPATLTRADAGALLQLYYGEGPSERGRAEGVITLDWHYAQVTQQPIADLCALCPEPVTVECELGDSLVPVVEALNAKLAAAGSSLRFFSLDVEADFYVIACRPVDFESRIATTGWLALG